LDHGVLDAKEFSNSGFHSISHIGWIFS